MFVLRVHGSWRCWTTLTGKPSAGSLSWDFFFLIVYSFWLILALRDRLARFAAGFLVLGPALRIFAWVIRASPRTELVIILFVRWTDVILWAGGFLYSIVWFKRKIRYV